MIVTEIFRETKQRTQIKSRKNGKRIIIIGSIVAVLLTTLFYSVGLPQRDHLYSQLPLVATIPLVLLTSFNAIGISTIIIFFLWALGESTHSQVKNSLEQRHQKKIEEEAKAVRNQFNQYGHQDYSLQIDEAKQGLRHEILEVKEESKKGIEEVKKEFMPEFQKARQEYEKEKVARIKAENERDKTSIILNEVLAENFKLKEENKKLKGE